MKKRVPNLGLQCWGGVWKFIFIGQNRSSNQRSGMILEAQYKILTRRRTRVKVFIFNKICAFLVFEENTPNEIIPFRLSFSFRNKRHKCSLGRCTYLKTHKKLLTIKKCHIGRFWRLITVFLCFHNYVRLMFLKPK